MRKTELFLDVNSSYPVFEIDPEFSAEGQKRVFPEKARWYDFREKQTGEQRAWYKYSVHK